MDRISPLKRGEGYIFKIKLLVVLIAKNYILAVAKYIQGSIEGGIIIHCPMVYLKVSLYDRSYYNLTHPKWFSRLQDHLGIKSG